MQYTMLPPKTLKTIDQIQRNFLWGSTENRKKLHLVNWGIVTTPKQEGAGTKESSVKKYNPTSKSSMNISKQYH